MSPLVLVLAAVGVGCLLIAAALLGMATFVVRGNPDFVGVVSDCVEPRDEADPTPLDDELIRRRRLAEARYGGHVIEARHRVRG